MTEEEEFQARYREEQEFARRYKEELAFERRHLKETVADLRKGQKAIAAITDQVIKNAMSTKPVVVNQPVPVAKAAPVPEVKDWSEEVRDLQASIDHLYALGQQGKGGPMPFDRTSPGIVLPPGGSGTTRALFEDGTWKVVAPGDPWTYVKVSADFTTNSQSPVNVPGLSFTPAANQEYLVEAMLLIQSASTGSGTQPGVSWPTGLTDGAARIETTGASATGTVILNAPAGTAGSAAATGEPLAATSYPATVTATLITGPSVAGDFQITVKRS